MKIVACIPARYAATRFPYKLMQPLGNKTVLQHTYDNTLATGLFDDVIVVTDHEIIYNNILMHGGKVMMSKLQHESGTDRIAEAMQDIEADVVINVQGDEPFIQTEVLADMVSAFRDDASLQVASVMKKIETQSSIENPNIVKVVCDYNNFALYFSRSPIPYLRDVEITRTCYEHIGIYGYRKDALLAFTQLPVSILEKTEKLEQLRLLQNGIRIKMLETTVAMIKIDVPEDLQIAEDFLRAQQNS